MILVAYSDFNYFGTAIAHYDRQKQISKGGIEMKKFASVLGVVFLIGAFALPVMAHGPGPGAGWGPGAKGNRGGGPGHCWDDGSAPGALTAEQQSKMEELSRNFYDETAQARDALWSKMGELNRLFNSENPDAEMAKTLQREISDLRAKMAQARIEFELEERKIAPEGSNRSGSGRGYGPGMRGNGPGMRGYGPGMRGSYGPGMRGSYGPGMRGGYGPGMRGHGPGMMGGYGPGMRGYGPGMRGGYGPGMGYYGHHMGGNGPGMMGPGWHQRGGYGPEACWR